MRASLALAALLPALATGGCSPPRVVPAPAPITAPAPPPARAPAPVIAPAPAALASDWRDWPLTPGDWVYRQDARGSIALYGPRDRDALLVLRCDRAARQIYLSRSGTATPTPMTVRTTSLTRLLTTQPTGANPPYLAVALSPGDPLLDAMGFSRGRFVVEQPGLPTLVVPAWAEIERVTEDCRG